MKKILLIIAIFFVVSFLFYSYFEIFVKNRNLFDQKNTIIKIEGGEKNIEIGEKIDLSVSYKNDNKENLKNAVLVLNFSGVGFSDIKDNSGFGKINNSSITWTIGDIAAGFEGVLKASARINDISANHISASLDYDPDNFSSHFSAKSEYSLAINPARISLNLYAPRETVAGQEIKYTLIYTNATAIDFEAAKIKINYPNGFVFSSASLPASEEGAWEILNLTGGSSGQLEIVGYLNGTGGEIKTIKAILEQKNKNGEYFLNNEIAMDTKIISSPFSIVEMINEKENYSASAGETLHYKIKFRNLDKINYNNLIVSAVLEGEALDYTSLEALGALVDKQLHSVVWNGKTNPVLLNLKPDDEAEFVFSVKTKETMPITDGNSKNFTVKNVIDIKNGNIFDVDGANKIIVSSSFETKINSSVILFTRGYFNDNDLLKTSGAIPPKVGQTTVYNIHWQILNSSNKIKNAKIAGILPPGAKWTGNIFPSDNKIFYDAKTRAVVWEAGDIEAGVGIISPLREIIFQISVTPSATDVGNFLVLIDHNSLIATDEFTLKEISINSEGMTTRLPDDLSVGPEEGKVIF